MSSGTEPLTTCVTVCLAQWDELITRLSLASQDTAIYEDSRARFKLWIASLGLSLSNIQPFEHIFRSNESTRLAVTQIVTAIRANLQLCLELGIAPSSSKAHLPGQSKLSSDKGNFKEGESSASSASSSDTDGSSEVASSGGSEEETPQEQNPHFAQKRIDDGIDRLIRISTSIRQHGNAKRRLKALRDDPVDPQGISIVDEFVCYAQLALKREVGPKRFSEADFSPLGERLLRQIEERWRRLSYSLKRTIATSVSESNHRKQSYATKDSTPKVVASRSEDAQNESTQVKQESDSNRVPARKGDIAASTVPSSFAVREQRSMSGPSSSKAGSTANLGQLEIPNPPLETINSVPRFGKPHFLCPLCRVVQRFDPTSKSSWERHFVQDLAPYSCLFPECEQQETVFSNSISWTNHMRLDHGEPTWRCPECKDSNHPTHGEEHTAQSIEFTSEGTLEEHMEVTHPEISISGQLAFIRRLCLRRKPFLFRACLLCGIGYEKLNPNQGNVSIRIEDTQDIMLQHMRHHLYCCALISVPWNGWGVPSDGADSNKAQMTEGDIDAIDLKPIATTESRGEIATARLDDIKASFGEPKQEDDVRQVSDWMDGDFEIPEIDRVHEEQDESEVSSNEASVPNDAAVSTVASMNYSLSTLMQWIQENSQPSYDITTSEISWDKQFVPAELVESHFQTPNNQYWVARCLLKEVFPDVEPPPVSARAVSEKCCRGMCILVMIGRPQLIRAFVAHDSLWDNKLPFDPGARPSDFPETQDHMLYEEFINNQWRFCAPRMENIDDWRVGKERIFPFIKGSTRVFHHRTSDVHRVQIHVKHDSLIERPDDGNQHAQLYTLKTFRGQDAERNFERERTAFSNISRASRMKPEGLIRFFQSFRYGETLNVLLEHAECNLEDFFNERPRPTLGYEMIQFWESFLEVVKGISVLHRPRLPSDYQPASVGRGASIHGWHHDLRPENILAILDNSSEYPWKFKVADLALCHSTTVLERGLDSLDFDAFGHRTYLPPECLGLSKFVFDTPSAAINAVDIWSLGCVLLEVSVWAVGGISRLQRFRLTRRGAADLSNNPTIDYFHNGEVLLPEIKMALQELRGDFRPDDYITGRVVDMFVPRMLDQDPLARSTAAQLVSLAEDMIAYAKADISRLSSWVSKNSIEEVYASPSPSLVRSVALPNAMSEAQAATNMLSAESPTTGSNDLLSIPQTPILAKSSLNRQSVGRIPVLSVSEASEWRIQKKSSGKSQYNRLPNEELLRLLDGRDLIFILDDSRNMQNFQKEMADLVGILTYLTKDCDSSRLELHFLRSDASLTSKQSKKFSDLVGAHRFDGFTDLQRMRDLLYKYIREAEHAPRGPLSLLRQRKTLTKKAIYVLTDGRLALDDAEATIGGIQFVMQKIATSGLPCDSITIQFISFGADVEGLVRLEQLANLPKPQLLPSGIVDSEPHTGNVWKMLVGAVQPHFDEDPRQPTIIDKRLDRDFRLRHGQSVGTEELPSTALLANVESGVRGSETVSAATEAAISDDWDSYVLSWTSQEKDTPEVGRASDREPTSERGGLVQDSVSTYRLSADALEGWLRKKFSADHYGHIDFNVELLRDMWNFVAPRRLTDDEKDRQVDRLRVPPRKNSTSRPYVRPQNEPQLSSKASSLVQDSVDHYRLTRRDLEQYLRDKFPERGEDGFDMEMRGYAYEFLVPRKLTIDEKEEIDGMRWDDDYTDHESGDLGSNFVQESV